MCPGSQVDWEAVPGSREAVGTPQANVTAMACAREGGRVVLLGSSRGLTRNFDMWQLAQQRNLERHLELPPEVLESLRARQHTPVFMLSGHDQVEDRVRGLQLGADDYLVKPFAFAELLARLRALLRRPPLQAGTVLRAGLVAMDTAARRVTCDGRPVRVGDGALDRAGRRLRLCEYRSREDGDAQKHARQTRNDSHSLFPQRM